MRRRSRCWCRARRRAISCCSVSRSRQCRAARHRQFLGRRGRQGRGALRRGDRQAAVRGAGRSAAQGATRGDREQGGNAFMEEQVPQAVIALKQGVGRLIRDEAGFRRGHALRPTPGDQGLWTAVLDSLPPMRATRASRRCRLFRAGRLGRSSSACSQSTPRPKPARRPVAGPTARLRQRFTVTERGHAELILPMMDELLVEAGSRPRISTGSRSAADPAGFTGLRIAAGVVQGLAYGADLRVAPVSSLAPSVAGLRVSVALRLGRGVLVCNDARMGEVYWGCYRSTGDLPACRSRRRASAVGPRRPRRDRRRAVAPLRGQRHRAVPGAAGPARSRRDCAMHDGAVPAGRRRSRGSAQRVLRQAAAWTRRGIAGLCP